MINFLFPVLGYCLGAMPFGLILAKMAGHGDIRNIGSGNIGATNVLRTGNKFLAALTLALDILKGAVAVWISFASGDAFIIMLTALAAVFGHMFPVWLKFKGGKGVATGLGVFFALMPPLGIAMAVIWLLTAVFFRISSLAALTAFALAPPLAFLWLGDLNLTVVSAVIAIFVFWKHRENIKRLQRGEEPKIGKKNDEPTAKPAK